MQYIEMPKYVKSIKGGNGKKKVKEGEVFDTSSPNNFSKYTWEEILVKAFGINNWASNFEEITKEEFLISKGLPLLIKTPDYEIY